MKDCTIDTAVHFLFEHILTKFGCLNILMSDRGTHFTNDTIQAFTEEFRIHHAKITPYHPQENGMVEAFNKIMEQEVTKICNFDRSDWDVRITSVLWAYRTTCKKFIGKTLFRMVYGKEAIIPMEYIVPSLCITTFTNIPEPNIMEECLAQLVALEEDLFISNFHQQVQKTREKAWHDRHIRQKVFLEGELVPLYDSQFAKHPGKFHQHWMGPYMVKEINDGGAVRLATLCSDIVPGYVNGNRLKPYWIK